MGEICLKASEERANKYAKEFCLLPNLHDNFERELLDKEIRAW
jgi:hypothetical protein